MTLLGTITVTLLKKHMVTFDICCAIMRVMIRGGHIQYLWIYFSVRLILCADWCVVTTETFSWHISLPPSHKPVLTNPWFTNPRGGGGFAISSRWLPKNIVNLRVRSLYVKTITIFFVFISYFCKKAMGYRMTNIIWWQWVQKLSHREISVTPPNATLRWILLLWRLRIIFALFSLS
jgi:hypothetical protein